MYCDIISMSLCYLRLDVWCPSIITWGIYGYWGPSRPLGIGIFFCICVGCPLGGIWRKVMLAIAWHCNLLLGIRLTRMYWPCRSRNGGGMIHRSYTYGRISKGGLPFYVFDEGFTPSRFNNDAHLLFCRLFSWSCFGLLSLLLMFCCGFMILGFRTVWPTFDPWGHSAGQGALCVVSWWWRIVYSMNGWHVPETICWY